MLNTPEDIQNKRASEDQVKEVINLYEKGDIKETLDHAQQLSQKYPDTATLHNILGACLSHTGQPKQSLYHFKEALRLEPSNPATYNNLGTILIDLQQYEEAQKILEYAIKIKPNFAEAYNNLGNALKEQEAYEKALPCYEKAIKFNAHYFEAYNNLGVALHKLKHYVEAEKNLRQALKLNPEFAEACCNIGSVLSDQKKYQEAITYFNKALKINPNYAEAYNNIGSCLRDKGCLNESILSFNQAISIKPNYPDALYNKGNSLRDQEKLLDALNCYNQALKLNPDLFKTYSVRLFLLNQICDWSELDDLKTKLPQLGITTPSVDPFAMQVMEDHAARTLTRISKYSLEKYNEDPIPLPAKPKTKPNKLRIGYFSADFQEHPVSHQIAKVLATHDRSKIEVYAYSFKQANDAMQKQIMQSVDHFKDVSDMSEKEIALLARKDNIHIAIDLMGYTDGSRANIFAFRAAPVQMHLFEGTMGAKFMDYIIADPTLIPDRLKQYYQEKIIYLPHSYMPTDNTREISTKPMIRKKMGLPEDGFVFCCFNNNHKISPREFDIWMRLLHKIKGSVLWLKEPNQWAKSNLQKEAKQRGIDPSRLVFAENVIKEDHLARHKLADLFLDTFNFNAHSTACDALWAGLPLITKKGEQFIARCAASMVNAIGLPELIVKTEDDYEALALELATNKPLLTSITEKLAKNKMTTPLFDTDTYTQNLEKAFEKVHTHYYKHVSPDDIWI